MSYLEYDDSQSLQRNNDRERIEEFQDLHLQILQYLWESTRQRRSENPKENRISRQETWQFGVCWARNNLRIQEHLYLRSSVKGEDMSVNV